MEAENVMGTVTVEMSWEDAVMLYAHLLGDINTGERVKATADTFIVMPLPVNSISHLRRVADSLSKPLNI